MSEVRGVFELVPPGRLRDHLVDAVLRGVKTVTSRLQVMDDMDGVVQEPPGTELDLVDSNQNPVCTVSIREVLHLPLSEVGLDVALAEGDWFHSVEQWREAHERHWQDYLPAIREYLDDPTWNLTDDTMVIVRFFDIADLG